MVGSRLGSKGAEEEMQYVKKHVVYEKVPMSQCYFHARARRRVYIELPEGDVGGPGSRQCGLLRKSLYGTRDAAQNWECELGGFLEEIGLRRGQASTCQDSDEAWGIRPRGTTLSG